MKTQLIEEIIALFSPQIDRQTIITRAEYVKRWERVQAAMKEMGYDMAYACGSELDRSDIAWLILIPADGTPVVVAGSEGGHVVEDCLKTSGAKLTLLQEFQISDEDYRFARFETLEDVVNRMVAFKRGKPVRVALLSSSQFIPHDHVGIFTGRFGADNVNFDVDLLQHIKYEKSPRELSLIGTANTIADAAFLGMLAVLEPGIHELDVAAVGDYIMKRLGAGRTGFPTIVTSGHRGRSVLGPATNRIIQKGEIVSLGISPTFNGYHGIMRRTVKADGEWTGEERRFLEALQGLYHEVMRAVQEAARGGLPSKYIDEQGKDYLEKTKLQDCRGRQLTPREPYTFIHNTGCSECQEGFGAVTPYTTAPLGKNVALMIDVAFMGFDESGELVFPFEYAVIEDSFWKQGKVTGAYNRMPLDVQGLVGKDCRSVPQEMINPYFRPWEEKR
jgi:Xaa-Pro aminopeptidase